MTRFLVDAHLPLKLARAISAARFDRLYTRDLPQANATKDSEVNVLSLAERRVVVEAVRQVIEAFTR